jgi:D-beta-D-heptose 7-phosphate kinase/D-beta-D-heptose 1-phosphate adenosyltransferase
MNIGLIGDHISDVYIYGKVERISPESPAPIFTQIRTELRPGGAGNVKENLKSLGAEVIYYHDSASSLKTRYVCDNHIIFRSDDDVIVNNEKTVYEFDDSVEYVILSDYNKGYISNPLKTIQQLIIDGKTVIVDPKKHLSNYAGSSIIKLNEKEYSSYADDLEYTLAAKKYVTRALVITRANKSTIIATSETVTEVETEEHQVADVTGAGDVFIAAMTYYLACGDSLELAVKKANKLASISVTKFGTYVLTKNDIEAINCSVVFTNGCFDIIHRGHIEYLKKSRALGNRLIVGINSDTSIRRLKGLSRPFTKQEDRKAILESISFVDEVIIFDEDTPYELIKQVQPNIITKGGDYLAENVVGKDLAEVVIIPYINGYSTTKIMGST